MEYGLLYLFLYQEHEGPKINPIFGGVAVFIIFSICVYYVLRYLETIYVKFYKRPYFIHWYFRMRKLPDAMRRFLEENTFYKKLNKRKKQYFEHRVACFLDTTDFVGREEMKVTDEMKMKISMIVIQLTFGMRKYLIEYLTTIILYPSTFFSVLNQREHKGEFNPRSKALVLSWEHFQNKNQKTLDSNLGIHEVAHAIHYTAIKNTDISAEIFYDTFLELEQYLNSPEMKEKVLKANILRAYAFTDKYEFVAVLIEVFMLSPMKLKTHLPKVYDYVSQMLNFRYFDE